MHTLPRSILGLIALCAFTVPSFAMSFAPLRDLARADFFQPLAPTRDILDNIDRGAVVPVPPPRPTQGANIMTATDCSMTRSSDGMLLDMTPARLALNGSVGLVV